ncbi:MAG TPA: acyl-CoA dehydrogenase family protein [Usitatibacteraceae bacterium]|nr:acyl-CoA dehydrogenase family protein [Usitatibacteraceae bacterium]
MSANPDSIDTTLLESCARLAEEARGLAKKCDAEEAYDPRLWDTVKSLGLAGLCVPEAQGGAQVGTTLFCRVCEALAVADTTTSTLVHLQGNNAFLLRGAPNRATADRVLEEMAAGGILTAYALTEPGAGSDAARIQATARPEAGGYVLNGTKCFSSWANMADVVLVFARITTLPAREAISCFVVRPPAKGFVISRKEKKMGLRASPLCEISLQDLFVPEADCLGPEGLFRQALASLDYSRVGIAAMAVGLAQGAFEYAFRYVHERKAFGQAVADFQGVQFKLADMATDIEAARALTMKCAAEADAGRPFSKLASMAKYHASDVAMRVTTDAVQLLGGHGYTGEHPVERMMRDAKAIQIFEGANELQRMLTFRALRKELA